MPKLRHRVSYRTLKFDTPDGDLHDGQYAFYEDCYYVRLHPENNNQWVVLNEVLTPDIDIPATIAGLTEVHVLDGEHMYYDEFFLPNGRIFRRVLTKEDYEALALPDAPISSAILTMKDISDVQIKDVLWQGKDLKRKNVSV